jgi:2-polyprenyl-3-methyl-5-hydroxy-6-metoxy-1,4-benzoquinol methylase
MTNTNALETGKHYASCPVCQSRTQPWRSKVNDGITYHIDRCVGCGYAFVNPRPDLLWLANWYSQSGHHTSQTEAANQSTTLEVIMAREQSEPNSTFDSKRLITTIRDLLPKADPMSILDVGCGYGFFSLEAMKQGFSVTALELAREEIGIASKLLGLSPISTSFEDFVPPDEPFSAVLMSQILEHSFDVNLWVEKVNAILQTGGVFAIAVPNFNSFIRFFLNEREPYITPPAHLNYFTSESLKHLLRRHGFRIEEVQHISRIPDSVLAKKLPARFVPFVSPLSGAILRTANEIKLGMIINVYARKI